MCVIIIDRLIDRTTSKKKNLSRTSLRYSTDSNRYSNNTMHAHQHLLQHNIYKLCINDNVFLVPLWHNEVYFDNSGCEIIVICEPELPTNITIDDDNNIHTDILVDSRRLSTIIGNNEDICCTIGDKLIKLPSSDLFLKTDQHYIIKKEGLSKAISDDIYDITDLADIIIRVIIY